MSRVGVAPFCQVLEGSHILISWERGAGSTRLLIDIAGRLDNVLLRLEKRKKPMLLSLVFHDDQLLSGG